MNCSITFLGTGTSRGVPMLGCDCPACTSKDPRDTRLRCSALVSSPDTSILIDCGPDLRQQLLTNRITRVDALLLTHSHGDHLYGIDDLQMISNLQHRELPFYASRGDLALVKATFPYIDKLKHTSHSATMFSIQGEDSNKLRWSIPQLSYHCWEDTPQPARIGSFSVQPVPLLHGTLPTLGYRFGSLAYLTDCSCIPEDSYALLHDLDILVIDGLRPGPPHSTHFCFTSAIEEIRRINPRRAYLTHLTHDVLHSRNEAMLPPGVFLPYDGLTLTFQA